MRPLLPGEPLRVGRYEIEGSLGSGGMGTVYLGRSPGGRPAAIKVISPDYLGHPEAVARFRREAEMLGAVRSAYTAGLIDCELDTPPYWMATEYIPGPTLSAAVEADGAMAPGACAEVMAALAEGLADIHRHGICHRDLKPQNVILSATGPQLIDFGLARGTGASGLTLTGIAMGTPGYIAPEMVESDRLTPAADVFALGATMAWAATGRRPYGHGSFQAIYLRLMREQIDLEGVDPRLAAVIRSCVARDPAARPSPDEIITQCRHLRSIDGITPTRLLSHLAGARPPQPGAGPHPPEAAAPVPARAADAARGSVAAAATRAGAVADRSTRMAGTVAGRARFAGAARPAPDRHGPASGDSASPASGGHDQRRVRTRRLLTVTGVVVAAVLIFTGGAFAAISLLPATEPTPPASGTVMDPPSSGDLWPDDAGEPLPDETDSAPRRAGR
ncbi:serine/threonine-protein kinase [Actinoplanes siamensis]|uniref:Protein kinase domain-containing protein n=1 Tax=Actinoplanes siamensis TaxID=1223317 RepID=A0A919TNV7_9ACTN|nr:serine/threonine-protein kinase [Actinoplanes siamensis]GIF09189.1 hypothetical protein Asi03nite_67270 [Actinoplanes siamensis]